jgi:hypothetical protein
VAGVETHSVEEGDLRVTLVQTPVGTLRSAHRPSPAGRTNFLVEHPLKTAQDYQVETWIEEQTRFRSTEAPVQAHLAGAGRGAPDRGE